MLVSCDPAQANPRTHSLMLLDRYLAATIDLHRQVKHAQWNLGGPCATAILETLDKVTNTLDYCCDLIVAHAVLLGGAVNGTVQVTAARSFLARYPLDKADARVHAAAVIGVMETLADSLRDAGAYATANHDSDTAALLIEIARFIERQTWLVGSAAAAAGHRLPRLRIMPRVVAEGIGPDLPTHRRPDRRSASLAAAGGHDRGATAAVMP